MSLNGILLACAAILPAVALGIYIFKKDRAEKEPIGLLVALLLLGCAICIPVVEVGGILNAVIGAIFRLFAVEADGQLLLSSTMYTIYNVVDNFIGVALVEEGFKFLAMFLLTRNSKHFNSLFDGIVYAVFVSLGFAGLENILYVFQYGWMTALMRAVLSVPGHMFFGVLMGYYYSFWHMNGKVAQLERNMKDAGLIDRSIPECSGTPSLVRSLVMPILAHGMYDFCCTMNSAVYTVAFYAFVAFLYYYCFKQIRKMSRIDMEDDTLSVILLLDKHPHLKVLLEKKSEESVN